MQHKTGFRNYQEDGIVQATYKNMQQQQTLFQVRALERKYIGPTGTQDEKGQFIEKSLQEVFQLLDSIIDESDPDTDQPQIYHAYQTGEALRELIDNTNSLKPIPIKSLFTEKEWANLPDAIYHRFKNKTVSELFPHIMDWSWLPLVGFIHDLGKVLATKQFGALPQWFVVGDTFPVGVPFSKANVYAKAKFFVSNPDLKKPAQFSKHRGLETLTMSFGHDIYLYSVLKKAMTQLPLEALYIIRFHSFYAWHSPKDGQRGYTQYAIRKDWDLLLLLRAFQKCDLYSKKEAKPDLVSLEPYYKMLIEKYISKEPDRRLRW